MDNIDFIKAENLKGHWFKKKKKMNYRVGENKCKAYGS
jgi:hypothetical protein